MRPALLGASALGIVAAVSLAASPIAAAATTPTGQPTPEQMSHAAGHMLVWEDVTPAMKVAPGWEFTTKADKSLALELCTKSGKAISAPKAPVMFQTELGETDLKTDPVAFQQNIWQYPDTTAAQKAWSTLQKRAKRCTGQIVEATPGEKSNVQHLSNGATEALVNGQPGVWIHSYFDRRVSESATTEGGYYVMFLNGNVMQSVEYDYPDTVDLSPALRTQVQGIAQTLATRWSQP